MSEQPEPIVASDIQDAYAEIGRSLIGIAIEQARGAGIVCSGEMETSVTIRLLFESCAATSPAELCCICTRDAAGVWTCAGPGCPAASGW